MARNYPITVYEIPDPKEDEELWHNGGLTDLARAIIASLQRDGLKFSENGDIIEVCTKVTVSTKIVMSIEDAIELVKKADEEA